MADPAEVSRRSALIHRFENIVFDEAANQLLVDDKPVAIEPRPLRLLAELLQHVNEVVTKEELFDSVWDGRPTVDNVLPTAINRLRKALGEVAARRIINLPRVGYRLDGPVERVARDAAEGAPPVFQPGSPVPGKESHVFVRPLGEGASGRVWLVRHAKLGGERVFKFGFDPQALRALKREFTLSRVLTETLASDHQVAVPLIDANFAQPPFFLEMDYGGLNLCQWAEADGRLQAMALPERLALFVQIARAVAAAHSVGVLHKDIKPANVLVSGKAGEWVARLTDFGSGRVLDPDRLKALGLTALGMTQTQLNDADASGGTPLYLAPELLTGAPATMQSDIYSLGVMLYQLVVGDLWRPLVSGWQRGVADELLVQDILAATDGNIAHRLAAAAELADRIMQLEPRRRAQAEQMQREAAAAALSANEVAAMHQRRARRPLLFALGAALVLGLATSLYFQWQGKLAAQNAQEEQARSAAISEFLQRDLLQGADSNRLPDARPVLLPDLLMHAAGRVSVRFASQPALEASVRRRLGEAFLRLVMPSRAEEQFRLAVALLEPLVSTADGHAAKEDLLASRLGLALSQAANYQAKNAEQSFRAALADPMVASLGQRLHLPSELSVLAARVETEVLLANGQDRAALETVLRLLDLTDRWLQAHVTDRFEARQLLADTYLRLQQVSDAQKVLDELRQPPFGKSGLAEVAMARASIHQAALLELEKKPEEAIAVLLEARAVLTAALGAESLQVGRVHYQLADLYSNGGQLLQAVDSLRHAKAAFTAALGPAHSYVASITVMQASMLVADEQPQAALQLLEPMTQRFSLNKLPTAAVDFYRACALADVGQHEQSKKLFSQLDLKVLADMHWSVDDWKWRVQAEHARMLLAQGQRAQGLQLLREAHAQMKLLGSAPLALARLKRKLNGV